MGCLTKPPMLRGKQIAQKYQAYKKKYKDKNRW